MTNVLTTFHFLKDEIEFFLFFKVFNQLKYVVMASTVVEDFHLLQNLGPTTTASFVDYLQPTQFKM